MGLKRRVLGIAVVAVVAGMLPGAPALAAASAPTPDPAPAIVTPRPGLDVSPQPRAHPHVTPARPRSSSAPSTPRIARQRPLASSAPINSTGPAPPAAPPRRSTKAAAARTPRPEPTLLPNLAPAAAPAVTRVRRIVDDARLKGALMALVVMIGASSTLLAISRRLRDPGIAR